MRYLYLTLLLFVITLSSCKKEIEETPNRSSFFSINEVKVIDGATITKYIENWGSNSVKTECYLWIDIEVTFRTNYHRGVVLEVYGKRNVLGRRVYKSEPLEVGDIEVEHKRVIRINHSMLLDGAGQYEFEVNARDVEKDEIVNYRNTNYPTNVLEEMCFEGRETVVVNESKFIGIDKDGDDYFSDLEKVALHLQSYKLANKSYKVMIYSNELGHENEVLAESDFFTTDFTPLPGTQNLYGYSIDVPIKTITPITKQTRTVNYLIEKEFNENVVPFSSYYFDGFEDGINDLPFEIVNVFWRNSIDKNNNGYDSFRELVIVSENLKPQGADITLYSKKYGGESYQKTLTTQKIISDTTVVQVYGSNVLAEGYYDFEFKVYNSGRDVFSISKEYFTILANQKFETDEEDVD